MTDLIANTVFSTGPDDKVATVDVYEPQVNTPKNNGVTSVGKDIVKTLNNDLAKLTTVKTLKSIVQFDVNGMTVMTKQQAMDKLSDAVGGVAGLKDKTIGPILASLGFDPAMASLDKQGLLAGVKAQSIGRAEDFVGKQLGMGDIRVMVGEVEHIRSDIKNVNSVQGAMDVLGKLSGDTLVGRVGIVKDNLAILSSVMGTLTELRIPDTVDRVMAAVHSQEERKQLLLANLGTTLEHSDTYTLERTIAESSAGAVMAKDPEAILKLLANYRLPEGQDAPDLTACNALLALLNSLDPNWDQYKRNGQMISNLSTYAAANAVCRRTLMLSPTHYVACVMASSYQSINMLVSAKQKFPHAAL